MDGLRPDYDKRTPKAYDHPQGFFWPPVLRDGYRRTKSPAIFCWREGIVEVANGVAPRPDHIYSTASVFTQFSDTHHLLAVNYDAQKENVEDRSGWKTLSFNHIGAPYHGGCYSEINLYGGEQKLFARGPIPNLIPTIYDPLHPPKNGVSAGLIGSLPILLALAAFSAPEDRLVHTLTTCIRPGRWQNHTEGNGRTLHSTLEDS